MRLLIEHLALSPVASPDDPNAICPYRKPNGKNAATGSPEGEVPLLGGAMFCILGQDEIRVVEHRRRELEGYPVPGLVLTSLTEIALELHSRILPDTPLEYQWRNSRNVVLFHRTTCTAPLEKRYTGGANSGRSLLVS